MKLSDLPIPESVSANCEAIDLTWPDEQVNAPRTLLIARRNCPECSKPVLLVTRVTGTSPVRNFWFGRYIPMG